MTRLKVYQAISRITAAISKSGVPKGHLNLRDQYFYRSIDDVVNCLSPLLARHKLCILPRVLERTASEETGEQEQRLLRVVLKVAFDLVSAEDSSSHSVEAYGEAVDASDKATAKAMTAAYKCALGQLFCIPTCGEEADAGSPRLKGPRHDPAPAEGWEQWSKGIIETIAICESREALERVKVTHRNQLKTISRERRDLYDAIGSAFSNRTKEHEKTKRVAAPPSKNRGAPNARASTKPVIPHLAAELVNA